MTPPATCLVVPFALATVLLLAAPAGAQHPTSGSPSSQSIDSKQPMYVAQRSADGQQSLAAMQLGQGLQSSLVAAEPDLCNAVAFAIDDQGRIYVVETFRIHDGVFDTREYMQWKDDDLACLTVADRVRKYERHIKDDIPKYASYSDRVKLLFDDNGDFVVDRSTVFADGFAALEDGIASSVLPIGKDVWLTNIPKLWKLRDQDGDGRAEVREATFDGFGVHTSLIGHDLHGLVLGPDRRLYFSIGDRGFDVTTKEGIRLSYPHEGAVLRCELDGSRLEVVHRGLRNPQELAFDDRGNLFTGDNNSDGGDRARFVQIVDGADSGWRIGFQWLDDRGAWNRERLWWPTHDQSPAATFAPILNIADGPSGLAFDPGQGLPGRYRGCFFLCDFRGGSSYSGVHALRFAEKGAGFELEWRDRPLWNVLATDVDFGPDGAMYVSDWVSGWNKTGKGRIYRIEAKGLRNDLQARAAARLIGSDLTAAPDAQLVELLRHQDRRVRQKAQFALVDRDARSLLLAAAKDQDGGKARLCGIWGLGILGRSDRAAVEPLVALLGDNDADVRAQTAHVLGDAHLLTATDKLVDALKDSSARVQREAALALARIGRAAATSLGEPTITALIDAVSSNADRDPVLRHAFAQAMAGIQEADRVVALTSDHRGSVRLAAVLALRFSRDARIVAFLNDGDVVIRREAARAIYDTDLAAALPKLASTLGNVDCNDEPFAWRALNAARLLGGADNAARLAAYATNADRPIAMRGEALAILGEWRAPHGQDRVLGNWRPALRSDDDRNDASWHERIVAMLPFDPLAEAAAKACASQRITAASAPLASVAMDRARPERVRTAALQALAALDDAAVDTIVAGITDEDPTNLRTEAVKLFAKREPRKAAPVLASLCRKAGRQERQAAFAALGALQDDSGAVVLGEWLTALAKGQVDAEVQLDVLLAAAERTEPSLVQRLRDLEAARDPNDLLAAFTVCLEGGDVEQGRRIFFDNEATRCTRCHTADGKGGNAGPVLDGIGKQPRPYLLESLVVPSKVIAQGFATTMLHLHNGDVLAGIVTKDQDGMVEITGIDGQSQKVEHARIQTRRTATDSAMPAMGGSLDRRQLRDLIAFLSHMQTAAK